MLAFIAFFYGYYELEKNDWYGMASVPRQIHDSLFSSKRITIAPPSGAARAAGAADSSSKHGDRLTLQFPSVYAPQTVCARQLRVYWFADAGDGMICI